MSAARALALVRGREYVLPQDVRDLAKDALHHRIVLRYEALAAEVGADSIVDGPRGRARARDRPGGARHDRRPHPRTPDRPGPACPEALLRALDLKIGRRLDGCSPASIGRPRSDRNRARAASRVGAGRRRPPDRLERHAVANRAGEGRRRRAGADVVVLDVSPSMRFGTADRRKWDVAEGVAVALGHLASRRGNRIGVATFGARTTRCTASASGARGAALGPARRPARARDRARGADLDRDRRHPARPGRAAALAGRGRLGLPGPARLAAHCSGSRRGTPSWRSRSGTRASRNRRTSATSGSSIPRRGGRLTSTPPPPAP